MGLTVSISRTWRIDKHHAFYWSGYEGSISWRFMVGVWQNYPSCDIYIGIKRKRSALTHYVGIMWDDDFGTELQKLRFYDAL